MWTPCKEVDVASVVEEVESSLYDVGGTPLWLAPLDASLSGEDSHTRVEVVIQTEQG